MTASICVGNLVPMLLSHLPLLGAEPCWRRVPITAAAQAAALADMFEAVAIWQKPSTAALLRHRQCRLRLGITVCFTVCSPLSQASGGFP